MNSEFEKIVHITPAYDSRNKGGGIGNCKLVMVVKGPKGAVTFTMGTAWYLPATFEWKQTCIERTGIESWETKGYAVGYCSPVQLHDYDEPRENCDWLGCTCYGSIGFSISDEVKDILIKEGSDAVWKWLENYYRQIFESTDERSVATGAK